MNNIVFFVNMKNNLKKMPTLVRFWEDFGEVSIDIFLGLPLNTIQVSKLRTCV